MQSTKVLVLSAIVGVIGISACSSSTTPKSASITASTTVAPASGVGFNPADVSFAQGMIPHHQQAVEMADLALNASAGASIPVKDLATRIKGAQDPEIKLMQGWLLAWKQPAAMPGSASGAMDGMQHMDGMMSPVEMEALKKAVGPAFDKIWLTMMITHHEGAVTMAQSEKTSGASAEAKALADGIIAGQQGEIAEMKKLLGV